MRAGIRAEESGVRRRKACAYASDAQERSEDVTVHPFALNACATRVVPVKTSMIVLGAEEGQCSETNESISWIRAALLPMYFTPDVGGGAEEEFI